MQIKIEKRMAVRLHSQWSDKINQIGYGSCRKGRIVGRRVLGHDTDNFAKDLVTLTRQLLKIDLVQAQLLHACLAVCVQSFHFVVQLN